MEKDKPITPWISENPSYQFLVYKAPPAVGYWLLDGDHSYGTRYPVVKKPNWFHRKMIQLCFGFKWYNND